MIPSPGILPKRSHNLATSLRCRGRSNALADYDRLPAAARAWLAQAALPWSAASVRRLWQDGASPGASLDRLAACEARLLAKDAARIWGAGYPTQTDHR